MTPQRAPGELSGAPGLVDDLFTHPERHMRCPNASCHTGPVFFVHAEHARDSYPYPHETVEAEFRRPVCGLAFTVRAMRLC